MIRCSSLLSGICRKPAVRAFLSTTTETLPKIVSSKVNYDNGVAMLTLNRRPVNSLDTATITGLLEEIQVLEKDPGCRALVFSSTVPGIFSAGVDLPEFLEDFPKRFRNFWSIFQDAFMALYNTRLATVSAINGHAVAGGCVLAMACDYIIMTRGSYNIGLNEAQLNMFLPFWICDRFRHLVGHRQAEKHLQLGTLFRPEQALSVGLVDELCDDNELLEIATSELTKRLQVQDDTRAMLKDYHRAALHSSMQSRKQEDIDFMVNNISREECQQTIETILKKLRQKKHK